MAAHVLAHWSFSNRIFGFFIYYVSAPPPLLSAIHKDACFVSVYLVRLGKKIRRRGTTLASCNKKGKSGGQCQPKCL